MNQTKSLGVFVFAACLAISNWSVADEVLLNGGFETGDLTGWTESVGQGFVVMEANGAGFDPSAPRSGSFMFSSSTINGAAGGQPEITISQTIDVTGFSDIATGLANISATGFFAGGTAVPIGGGPSDDTAQLTVEFFDGGTAGTSLGILSTIAIDPALGFWNQLSLPSTSIPVTTDTVLFSVVTRLDDIPNVVSIDILADDLSVTITTVPEPSSAIILVIATGLAFFRRRS